MQPNPHRPPKVGGSAVALNKKPGPALHSVVQAIRRIPAARRDGGEGDGAAARLGVVKPTNERQQVLGTCSPVRHISPALESLLMSRLWEVRDTCITGPEQRAVDDCLKAARKVFGRDPS